MNGTSQDRLAAVIASIPPLFWVPILMEKKTPFVAHYMKHGFGLLMITIVLSILMSFLGFFALFLYPIYKLLNLIVFILTVYLAYHAYQGNKVTIPYYTENLEKVLIQLGIKSWFEGK